MRTAAVAAVAAVAGSWLTLRGVEWALEVYVRHGARPADDARMMP